MNLRNLEKLRASCESVEAAASNLDWYQRWGDDLEEFLTYVRSTDLDARKTVSFHERLWNENPVAAPGQGNISVESAIQDPTFRERVADLSMTELPVNRESRISVLRDILTEIRTRLEKSSRKVPRLKLHRAMAALFPADFTTVAHGQKLRKLHTAMGLPAGAGAVARHANVLGRLEEALGPSGDDIESLVRRMRLPWLLYVALMEDDQEEATEESEARPGAEALKPLPAARRRRGMTGISGGFSSILNILEFAKDGATPEDLKDHIRSQLPQLKESSISTSVNVLIAEFNLLRRDGDFYRLTARGETLLESGDADDVVDWILTRILGADHVLVWLNLEGTLSTGALVKRLQRVNPGWTSSFGPTVLLSWLRQLELIERQEGGGYGLTESGRGWVDRIHWTPESLPPKGTEVTESDDLAAETGELEEVEEPGAVQLAALDLIQERVNQDAHFPESLIARLHHGLWAHHRRHFAVLTGLSGAGKTQLAMKYGRAVADSTTSPRAHVRVIPVQPGWHDPAPLLGYVNPLQGEVYVRTDFLEFLIQAASDPECPYTVILDEMNLSRPEQYLAPVLSAMETGASIVLHREGEVLDGVPAAVPYPSNLAIIGTVNMDETTHGLSDKVLDRAFTIEFWDIDLAKYPKWSTRGLSAEVERQARALLEGLMASLQPARLHFGWRTVDDVLDYLAAAARSNLPALESLDSVVYAKVLPKLRGDDSVRFREALEACHAVLTENNLPESSRRVEELKNDLSVSGSARFWR